MPEILKHDRRRSICTYDPRGSLKYRADTGSFRYFWPRGLDEKNFSRGRDDEGAPARDLSFYYIASGRGEADAQLFMPVSRPIGCIAYILQHTYHIYVYMVVIVMVVVNGCRTRALCVSYPSLQPFPATLFCLRAPPLCFFVRAKIINGPTKTQYAEVSVS